MGEGESVRRGRTMQPQHEKRGEMGWGTMGLKKKKGKRKGKRKQKMWDAW